jgi:uncharacterized protein (DUF1330 family)
MAAYLIVDTKIHDAAGYEEYKSLARPIAERFGGEYLVRGAPIDVIDEELWSPTRLVLLRFPDRASARAFIDSDEYAPVKQLRHAFADSTLLIVEGDE